MSRNKRWFLWQVGVPIFGPIIVSIVIILFWMSGNPNFAPRIDIILDVSPWALTFYTLTLIGSTLNGFWPKLPEHPVLGGALIAVAFVVGIYAAFTIIWRHDNSFTPGVPVYFVAIMLLLTAVGLCYIS
ncbi:MAG: hypothetical protein VCD50_17255 [Alphaproteobacteria bacterium]